jgi:hypothetical protein
VASCGLQIMNACVGGWFRGGFTCPGYYSCWGTGLTCFDLYARGPTSYNQLFNTKQPWGQLTVRVGGGNYGREVGSNSLAHTPATLLQALGVGGRHQLSLFTG